MRTLALLCLFEVTVQESMDTYRKICNVQARSNIFCKNLKYEFYKIFDIDCFSLNRTQKRPARNAINM